MNFCFVDINVEGGKMKKKLIILGMLMMTFLFVVLKNNDNQNIKQNQTHFNSIADYEKEEEDKTESKNVASANENLTKEEKSSEKKENVKKEIQTSKKKTDNQKKQYKISIPTYNQKKEGYPRGCEGVSLYMCLKGKGYIKNMSVDEFMETMPLSDSDSPEDGYVGDPTKSKDSVENSGKRTTIHPKPLSEWANKYGKCQNLQGKSVSQLIKEIKKGNPIIVWVTASWNNPKYKTYSFGTTVSNNHATCLVGYDEANDKLLVNDCSSKNTGEYWIDRSLFEKCYNPRKYAVVIK